LQLEQLQQPGLLAGGRGETQLAARVGQHDPAADAASRATLRSVSRCRKSITSKSATIVSARSTKVSDSSSVSI
jgi:hypothetical protein